MINFKIKVLNIFVAFLSFTGICNSQSQLYVYGDTAYIKTFSFYGSEVKYKNIFESTDSIIIRVWDGGKAYTISYLGDSLVGEKTIYVFSNPNRKKEKGKWTTIFKTNNLNSLECDEIYRQFQNYKIDFSKFKINTNNFKRHEGGIVSAIEFKVGDKYLIVTEDLFSPEETSFLKSTIQSIGLIDTEKEFKNKLPKGYWYNYGGTTSLYFMTRIEAIINRLEFWKR